MSVDLKRAGIDELRQQLFDNLSSYMDGQSIDKIEHAYRISDRALKGLERASGDAFIIHPLGMAAILSELKVDLPTMQASLLLTPFEKGRIDIETLQADEQIEPLAVELMQSTAKISNYSFRRGKITQPESFRKLILTVAKDARVLVIKLADRLNSMRTLKYLPKEVQREIAAETMDIYAPLAHRLGIHRIKSELEDISFRYLHPEQYMQLKEQVAKKKSEREEYISKVIREIRGLLDANGIDAVVYGRSKHFWSIAKKMERRGVEFDGLYDLTAFRIIVDTISECYLVLGLVHAKWRPIPGTFDDYIAMPKPNGYQSLHTAVYGPNGERIEVQIRTRLMHEVAEHGVAAHWAYKEKGSVRADETHKVFGAIQEALSAGAGMSDPKILNALRTDLFDDDVFVFTPQGDVKELPKGATPIDFAYAIHTEVGNHCTGAKVNGNIVPLNYELKNGDTVEIITHPRANPSADWLEFVHTERARQKIRHYLSQQQREQERELGRSLLEKQLKERKYSLSKLLKEHESKVSDALERLKLRNMDELYLQIGRGRMDVEEFVSKVLPEVEQEPHETGIDITQIETKPLRPSRKKKSKSGVLVGGMPDIVVRFAKCCNPIIGDEIVGFITRGRGVTIHRKDCPRIPANAKERLIDAEWDVEAAETTPVRIKIIAQDRPGMLSAIGEVFKSFGANIASASAATIDGDGIMFFTINVHSVEELNRIINAIRQIKGVWDVIRVADSITGNQ